MTKYLLVPSFILRWIAVIVATTLLCYYTLFRGSYHGPSSVTSECCSLEEPIVLDLNGAVPFNQTTCNPRAYSNGDHQKVIVYVFYDDPDNSMTESRKYFYGIEVNARVNLKFYPGWRMWVYHDVPEGSDKHR